MPDELETARLIDRFGAQAVYGRPMSFKEMRRILHAEYLVSIKRAERDSRETYLEESDDTQAE